MLRVVWEVSIWLATVSILYCWGECREFICTGSFLSNQNRVLKKLSLYVQLIVSSSFFPFSHINELCWIHIPCISFCWIFIFAQESPDGNKMLEFRKSLPAFKEKERLLQAIARNQVILWWICDSFSVQCFYGDCIWQICCPSQWPSLFLIIWH